MKNLIIIGVGGCAREIYSYACGSFGYGIEFQIKGFLDGTVKLPLSEYESLQAPLLGDVNSYVVDTDDVFVVGIADSDVKKQIVEIMDAKDVSWFTLVHKTAIVDSTAVLEAGVVVHPFCLINCYSRLCRHVFLNNFVDVGHDTVIGDYSSLMPYVHIAGKCEVGKSTYWGSGARLIDHRTVTDDVVVGAGAVVTDNIEIGGTYVGVPAKRVVR